MTPQKELRRWGSGPVLGLAMVGIAWLGCAADGPKEPSAGAASEAIEKGAWEVMTLPWGAGASEVGLRSEVKDRPAEGPSAVFVAPGGAIAIVDRLNERALEVAPSGEVRTIAKVAADGEHGAMGRDGALVIWSPLRARMWVSSKDGESMGELAVPRALIDLERIEMGQSHRVYAVNSMQETVALGSPRAPLDLSAVLRTKREGAAFLADGRGVVGRVSKEHVGEIVTMQPGSKGEERATSKVAFVLDGAVSAIRIVGAVGDIACARISRVSQSPDGSLVVKREALCVDLEQGEVVAKREMGGRGLYAMHADVAVGGTPPMLVTAMPLEEGFRIERVALPSAKGEGLQ